MNHQQLNQMEAWELTVVDVSDEDLDQAALRRRPDCLLFCS